MGGGESHFLIKQLKLNVEICTHTVIILGFLFFFFFFGHAAGFLGPSFPNQGLNLGLSSESAES